MGDLFRDKVVLVTGSGQGIGRAIALSFATEGAKVVTNNRRPGGTRFVKMTEATYASMSEERKKEFDELSAGISGDAETTARQIENNGGSALPIYADISKPEEAEAMVEKIIHAYDAIHIVVNVAGVFGGGPFTEITEAQWDRVYNIKPKGYFNVMKAALPYMVRQHWGRILNTTSKAMMGDIIKMADYCAANAAVVGLTQAAACEYYHEGITVNAFSPFAKTRAFYERKYDTGLKDSIPGFGVFGTAIVTPECEAIPPFLLYLCTEECKNITGSVFNIGGNEIAIRQYPLVSRSVKRVGGDLWSPEELMIQAPRSLLKGYVNIVDAQ